MNERVQIPAYTDRWMMGDRFGEIVKAAPHKLSDRTVAHVKLDSGKTVRVFLEDCTPV